METRIVCIVDKEGRIQHKRLCFLAAYLGNCDVYALGQRKQIQWDKYKLVYYSNYSLVERVPCSKTKICSITSHKCLSKMKKTLSILKQFAGVSVNNKILFKNFKKHIKHLRYTPNGVDTVIFCPRDKETQSLLNIGWVGNKDRATKNYGFFRNLSNNGVKFNTVATSKKDPTLPKTADEMVQYYRTLDFFLIMSSTEGTPNPGLEALACGIPVITTRVGNMPEIVREGYNGFFIEDNVQSIQKAIETVGQLSLSKRQSMSNNARDSILQWDWSVKKDAWIKFFEEFL